MEELKHKKDPLLKGHSPLLSIITVSMNEIISDCFAREN